MNAWFRFRRWLHRHDRHRLCREVRVIDHYDDTPETVPLRDGDVLNVTTWGGRPVYRDDHG